MGMFDKDKLYGGARLDEAFNTGDKFIVHGVTVLADKVPTSVGDAEKSLLIVSRTDDPTKPFIVGTLASAIASKCKDAEPDDFPAVVALNKVPSSVAQGQDATVIQFHSPWTGETPESLPEWDNYLSDENN